MERYAPWAALLIVLVTTGVFGTLGYWIGSTSRTTEVYVHFDQPLVVKIVKGQ